MSVVLQVAVDAPGLPPLDYSAQAPLALGTLVRVPLGRQTVSGVVMTLVPQPDAARLAALRPIAAAHTALAPLAPAWLDLMQFVARYYQRALGEVIGAALPAQLRNRQPGEGTAAPPRSSNTSYRCTAAGLSALPGQIAPRSVALWRLARALGVAAAGETPAASTLPYLSLTEARRLHPQAVKVLADWEGSGWVEATAAAPVSSNPAASAACAVWASDFKSAPRTDRP